MAGDAPKQQTIDRIKQIIRQDLMVGPDAEIDDQEPLFGEGRFDLDSVDALLLLTVVEKEFGIKVPNEQIGREVLANVATLAAYVDQRLGELT